MVAGAAEAGEVCSGPSLRPATRSASAPRVSGSSGLKVATERASRPWETTARIWGCAQLADLPEAPGAASRAASAAMTTRRLISTDIDRAPRNLYRSQRGSRDLARADPARAGGGDHGAPAASRPVSRRWGGPVRERVAAYRATRERGAGIR